MSAKFAMGLGSNPGQERFIFILLFFFQIPYIKCLIFPRSLLDILLYNKDIGKINFYLISREVRKISKDSMLFSFTWGLWKWKEKTTKKDIL